MGATEKFCLKWNDFETNISVAFRDLREEKDFFDVTLACDDSQIQAHKVSILQPNTSIFGAALQSRSIFMRVGLQLVKNFGLWLQLQLQPFRQDILENIQKFSRCGGY
jgi:BTB/POZ domain